MAARRLEIRMLDYHHRHIQDLTGVEYEAATYSTANPLGEKYLIIFC
jgi:hypothetical protein